MKKEQEKGDIYIFTNPSFSEYVKIGYAEDVNDGLTLYQLEHRLEKKIYNK